MSLSVVIPVYNEVENIRPLYEAVRNALASFSYYELIFVNDGSTDGTDAELIDLANSDFRVKVIEFRGNLGQTPALRAGIQAASCDVVALIDGDLQNDPRDIPMMVEELAMGNDLIHGWRRDRHDAFLTRKLPSSIANWLIAKTTGYAAHDLGCTLKVMSKEVAQRLPLYGEMHRFIPVFAHWQGAGCKEVVVRHHPRRAGTSKYGLSRTIPVLLDLVTVKYLTQFASNPIRFFGAIGLIIGAVALLLTVAMITGALAGVGAAWLGLGVTIASVAWLASLQCFGIGLLAEHKLRNAFVLMDQSIHAIDRTWNLETASPIQVSDVIDRAA